MSLPVPPEPRTQSVAATVARRVEARGSAREPNVEARGSAREQHDQGAAHHILHSGDELSSRFVIRALHRDGGMAAVYLAEELATGAPVAIKVLARMSARRAQRFEREAAILASLEHPAIVHFVSSGTTREGAPYLAMEWLRGQDLAERLRGGRLSLEESVNVLRRACDGIAHAHRVGVVHRDVKPSNLFLEEGPEGRLKVLDFGIARMLEGSDAITLAGDFVGTVGYMAPEQAMGRAHVDARADVFALGCVFYECLTGSAPFESTHSVAVLAKVLREEPVPASELCAGLGPGFDLFLARVLAKDPAKRPADADAMRAELDALLAGQGAPDTRQRIGLTGAEQRIVSVILGKPSGAAEGPRTNQVATVDERDLRYLSLNFSADVSPLQGGALLVVLPGRGEANDRAVQAARCALALQKLRPELQLGVATGLAETSGPVPVGAAIDRAAELLAGPAHAANVLVDDLTAGLIGLRFDVRSSGTRNVLVGVKVELDAPRKLMGKPTPCVGREMELRLLESAMEECCADSVSRTVLVTGPPGIGKSRLASEWLGSRKACGSVRTLVARADPMTSTSALSLVQHLLRDAVGLHDPELAISRERLFDHLRPLLREACSTVAEFLAEVLGLPDAELASPLLKAARANPEIMREQVRRALDAWIAAETAKGPLLLVLEDLHWGDIPSVEFLIRALKRHADRPLMVLALARSEAEQLFPQLCQGASVQIRLPGLTRRAAERLIRATLSPPPSAELIAEVVSAAEGNVFYLEELIRRVASGTVVLPETVLAMAQSRLEHLEPMERCALRAASVFGETCWAEGVACIVDPSIDSRALLDLLAEREILVPVAAARYAGTHEYRFRHALLRDAAYAMLTPGDREHAHHAAGNWLEGIGEKEARLLAEHFASGKANDQAVHWLVRAARSAIDHGDLNSTIELANRGIALGAVGSDCGHLLLARGYAETWSGQTDLSGLREGLALLQHGTAPWWLAVALLTLAESASGRPHEASRYVSLALTAPSGFCSRAEPRASTSEQVGPYGQALHILVAALVLLGHGELAGTLIERAQAVPAAGEDPIFSAFLTAARCALASVAPVGGHWQLEYAYVQGWEGVQKMHDLGALCGEAMALNYFAVAATHLGRYQEAVDAGQRALRLAQHAGSGLNREWGQVFLAKAQVRLERLEDALRTLSSLHTSRDCNLLQMLPAIASEALFRQGRYAEAIAQAEIAVSGSSPRLRRMAGYIRARALLARSRPDQALSAIEDAFKERTTTGLDSEIDLHTVRAEILLANGDRDAAREVIRQVHAYVQGVAASIADPELRRSFLENVEPCARAQRLARELL